MKGCHDLKSGVISFPNCVSFYVSLSGETPYVEDVLCGCTSLSIATLAANNRVCKIREDCQLPHILPASTQNRLPDAGSRLPPAPFGRVRGLT